MQVHQPSGQLAGELREIGATMTAEWQKAAGPEGALILDKYARN